MAEIILTPQDVQKHKKYLIIAIALHLSFFVVELLISLLISNANSNAADSVDMLIDGLALIVALCVVNKSTSSKNKASVIVGCFQLFSALLVLTKIIYSFFYPETVSYIYVVCFGAGALLVNVIVVFLFKKIKNQGMHLKASYIFSFIDIYSNLGMIICGLLGMYVLHDKPVLVASLPDLIVATIIFILILTEGIKIFIEVKHDGEKEQEK
ncbi:MAG: cation transporter [Mycoplasmataceae bacterium]|jgi:Co/Zn/Cd efflux system component|nr:cation transporter [Mycoplasmataceae bacterium]